MRPPILILAIGNESRGDDALGPLLLRSLERWLRTHQQTEQFELIEEFQLQVEHAMDIAGRELVLFVDAGMGTSAPYTFQRIAPGDGRPLFSHALTPEGVLTTYTHIYNEAPPPSFVLCMRGEQFELGASLTDKAMTHLELAERFLHTLLEKPELAAWETLTADAASL